MILSQVMYARTGWLLVLVMALTCCKPKDQPQQAPGHEDQGWLEAASRLPSEGKEEARVEEAPQDTVPEPAGTRSITRKQKVLDPRILWTGSRYALVWIEAGEWEPRAHDLVTNVDPWDMTDIEDFEVYLLVIGEGDLEPVVLESAGEGPEKLVGPLFSNAAWHHGGLALAWAMWNEDAEPPYPARYVVGMWKPDGTPVAEPGIASKERIHDHRMAYDLAPDTRLVSTPVGLYLAVPADPSNKKSGCKGVHGASDSLELFRIGSTGEVQETLFECADVMGDYHLGRFGDGLMAIIHNHHVGYHAYMIFDLLGKHDHTEHWDHDRPLKDFLTTGGGAAVWYDELEDFERVTGHCVRIEIADGVKGGPEAECVRYKSRKLVWNDDGLLIRIAAKDGKTYTIPYLPGDQVHLKLLRKELEQKAPLTSAVFGGKSIGLVWSRGKKVMFQVIGRDAFEQEGADG